MPIFPRARYTPALIPSLYSRELITTLVVVTAKLTRFNFAAQGVELDARIDRILSSSSLEGDFFGDSPSIDQFRKACLLAFYEFHQFPGRQAWMRISKLTRMAYWTGLDRLDNSSPLHRCFAAMSQQDRADWRHVWWCIYRLDSYANFSSGTPYLIEEGIVCTALPNDWQIEPLEAAPSDLQGDQLFLPSNPNLLWQLVSLVAEEPQQETMLVHLHIVTVTALRQVGREFRAHIARAEGDRLANLEQSLTRVGLALPSGYRNPMRNALACETRSDHHSRLVTLLHWFMARLVLALLKCSLDDVEEETWLHSWQQVLESCQDIASVAEQWNSMYSLGVDPAVSFIMFTALVFVDLHKKFASAKPQLISNLEHYEAVLVLLLEQFARVWTLPRLLIRKYHAKMYVR